MGKKAGQIKAGQTLGQTNVQTPLLPLSGTRKVVRTPTNPFEAAGTVEVFVPKEIIARRIQAIFAGPNKGRKAEHYLVVWEDYPLKKDYTWEPIENLYGHEDLAQTYEQWLKTENERQKTKGFSFVVLTSHSNFVRRLIVVVCCVGSYRLRRPCRQVENHHRHRKLTKQGWRCRTGSRCLRSRPAL